MQHGVALADMLLVKPRAVIPGAIYMVVRRCTQRKFLLKPSKRNNAGFLFCLARAAKVARVQLLWTMVMSSHHHTGVHDPEGRIDVFTRELHRLVAKHHNCGYGRFENLWASTQPVQVRLEDRESVLDKLVYSLANSVSADLVDRVAQWPGVVTLPRDLCASRMVKRPKRYFRDEGDVEQTLELRFHKPPGFEDMSDDEFRGVVARRLEAAETKARATRRRRGREVVGRRAILRQHHEECPKSWAKRFQLRPRIATKDKWRRIEALRALEGFVDAYRTALKRWRAGEHDIEFPYGTNKMRWLHGVRCAPAPT